MNNNIKIITRDLKFLIALNNSKTSLKILEALPLESIVRRWGDEIYFKIPVHSELEDGIEILELGSVAYWPPGSSICIFFGKTPASTGDKPQAASPVTVIGKIIDKEIISELKKIKDGEKIEIKTVQ
jgi:hypothetical protein